MSYLLEWVGVGSPPGEEERQTDCLENAGKSADSDSIEWTLLRGDLCDELEVVSILFYAYTSQNFLERDGDDILKEQRKP